MKVGLYLSVFAAIWCVAVLVKVAAVRSRSEPYTFRQWDGGLALRGTSLGRGGTYAFGGFAIILGATALIMLRLWMKV